MDMFGKDHDSFEILCDVTLVEIRSQFMTILELLNRRLVVRFLVPTHHTPSVFGQVSYSSTSVNNHLDIDIMQHLINPRFKPL